MLVDNKFFEDFPTFLRSLKSNQREQLIKIIKIIEELKKKGKMYNKIIKKIIKNIITLVETRLLTIQNTITENCKDKETDNENNLINYDKVNDIVTKDKEVKIDFSIFKENIELLINSLKTLDEKFKNYIVKTTTEEFVNSNGQLLVLIPNIISHLTKLFE